MALFFRDTDSKASILILRCHLFQFANPSKELLSTHSLLCGVRCLVQALKISEESGAKGSFMVVFHFRTCLLGPWVKRQMLAHPRDQPRAGKRWRSPRPALFPSQAHSCPSSVLGPR